MANIHARYPDGLQVRCGGVVLVLLIFLASVAHAQIIVRFSPEPMAVPAAVIANAKQLGRWQVDMCNNGSTPVTIPIQRVMMASGNIPLIDPADSTLVLAANVRRSGPARAMRVLSWGLVGVGVATTLIAMRNSGDSTAELMSQVKWLKIGAGVSAAGTVIPPIMDAVKAEVPSATPLLSTLRWPLQLGPGGCETDHLFAGKMRSPKPLTVTLP